MVVKVLDSVFNLDILDNTDKTFNGLQEVTTTDIYDGKSKDFSDTGLFSNIIFGRVTERSRSTKFAYINLNTKILHPILFNNLIKISGFYYDIISGKKMAKWDDKTNDFIPSDVVDGSTGYTFFMSKLQKIKFTRNESELRGLKIDILEKYRAKGLYDKLLVLPAGLRDIEEGIDGGVKMDEINDIYRSIIGLSKNIDKNTLDNKFNDGTKLLIQRNVCTLYEIIFGYIQGKRGLIQNKFVKRRIDNGTGSVASSMDISLEYLQGEDTPEFNDVVMGLYQTCKSLIPLFIHEFKSSFISERFIGDNKAILIDSKSLKMMEVNIGSKLYDRMTTNDGINDLVNKFSEESIRHNPVTINGYYLALIYKTDDYFKIIPDTTMIPDNPPGGHGFMSKLRPITWAELIYYILRPISGGYAYVTRYPITGDKSTQPMKIYLRTTFKTTNVKELDDNWEPITAKLPYNEWPSPSEGFIDTISPPQRTLAGYDGDHDGDMFYAICLYTDEANKEVEEYLGNVDNILSNDGVVDALGKTELVGWLLKGYTEN
jgi:hypothetical protein